MKPLLLGLLVIGSMSAFGADIKMKCIGSSIKVSEKFSYSEDKRLMDADLLVNSEKSVMIIVNKDEMKVVKEKNDITNKKGSSILYITQASEEDDTLVDSVNVFHASLNTNRPGNSDDNLFDDLDVKTANVFAGSSLSMLDIEKGFGLNYRGKVTTTLILIR